MPIDNDDLILIYESLLDIHCTTLTVTQRNKIEERLWELKDDN